jgi:hypothetical protein
MRSARFGLPVVFTEHALRRMAERAMSEALVLDVIDTGTVRSADDMHLWIYKHIAERDDNLLCVAAVVENALIVKTVMHHWELQP